MLINLLLLFTILVADTAWLQEKFEGKKGVIRFRIRATKPVISHEKGKKRIVITTNGTYP